METINDLLQALDNKVPASIAKKLDGLTRLNKNLVTVREENDAKPTEDSQEKLDEIIEYISDYQDDLREDLSELVAKKREADVKNRQIAKNKRDEEAKALAEKQTLEAKKKEDLEQKELLEKEELEKKTLEQTKDDKKSGVNWFGLLLGGAFFAITGVAVNSLLKKR